MEDKISSWMIERQLFVVQLICIGTWIFKKLSLNLSPRQFTTIFTHLEIITSKRIQFQVPWQACFLFQGTRNEIGCIRLIAGICTLDFLHEISVAVVIPYYTLRRVTSYKCFCSTHLLQEVWRIFVSLIMLHPRFDCQN